ncbi:MAG: FecR domain-containing protein [Blastocatellia bacterium]|nr:FecR domain-containing protein [Blastocatellia bacterium]
MPEAKIKREFIDWYYISKATVYRFVGTVLSVVVLVGGGWWFYKYRESIQPAIIKIGTRLVQISGNVSIRRGAEIIKAESGMELQEGDTIQTGPDSTASLQYVDGSTLRVKSDSTVIVKENAQNRKDESTTVQNQIVYGTVNVSAMTPVPGSKNTLIAPDVQIDFTEKASVGINVDKDKKNTGVLVAEGSAFVTPNNGKPQSVRENVYVEFAAGTKALEVAVLPSPKLKSPDNSAMLVFESGQSPEVTFSWLPLNEAKNYKLQIASTPSFLAKSMLVDQALTSPVFNWPLKSVDANYYWRVVGVAKDGKEGVWSPEYRLQVIVKDVKTGQIRIDRPQITAIGGGLVEVAGSTEPGVQLTINGKLATVFNDGKYNKSVDLPGGRGRIVIEARDNSGRTSKRVESYP